jgi:hypothetical protein
VTCKWFFPNSRRTPARARHLLELVRHLCSEAVPVRFGMFEPLQGRLEHGNDEPFVLGWEQAASVPYGDWLFFQSRPPCFGGSVRSRTNATSIVRLGLSERPPSHSISMEGRLRTTAGATP